MPVSTPGWFENIVRCGFVGVPLFYVLSGFVLAYTYANTAKREDFTPRSFLSARFARIYPAYALSLLLSVPMLLAAFGDKPTGSDLVRRLIAHTTVLLLVQSWFVRTAYLWNYPAWSLSTEVGFYAAFPFLHRPLIRLSRWSLLCVGAGLWFGGISVSALYMILNPDRYTHFPTLAFMQERSLQTHSWMAILVFNPIFRLPEFLLGFIAGRLFALRAPAAKSLPSAVVWSAVAAIMVLIIISPRLPYLWITTSLLAPLWALLMYGLASGASLLSRILSHSVAVLLGECSYSIYILQAPVFWIASRIAASRGIGSSSLLVVFEMILITAVSIASLFLVERPARRWLRAAIGPSGVKSRPRVNSLTH